MAVLEISFMPGSDTSEAAKLLVERSAEFGAAFGMFNDIRMDARHGDTIEDVLAAFENRRQAHADAYAASPEARAAELARNDRRASMQAQHDALMARLPTLNLSDDAAVLDWLCAMQEPSDHVGVIVRKDAILEAFAKHGFKPGLNCGKDYRSGNRSNMHAYLVGQALDGLQSVAVHSILHKFAAEWRAEFGIETPNKGPER